MGDPFDLELARERREGFLREAEERRLARASRVNTWTDAWFRFRGWRERRRTLLREKQERALARETARVRAAFAAAEERPGTIEVRWGLPADEAAVADLLELNGMPRWVAFEERFIVAESDGKVLGALRYRTESKRLLLGLLVVDPWAGEERLARALYAGAGDLARELGVGEVVASVSREGYPGETGYRRRGRDWHLGATQAREAGDAAAGGWRRVLSLFGTLPVPFHRYR
ncbi:MAG: hypothetical protein AVDCRST_MAG58-2362 [uncultured Rubrobacteraceae bacterium]|uniref:N-acetyltransferase domain-containing protein n=1 Tax=uncultured Rubrobacteraceae bacterium TaxID=349277 RepID=A0A6J4R7X2_9ACTN|nr:MAG: hypothetical protein AVDCRST_MAG58-2362 [uncultured Rubrobacteraceae bacterium]